MLTVHILSFSFLKGLPADATGHGGGYVFDCRAIENPGRLPEFSDVTDQIGDFGDLKPLEEADHSQADTFDEQACTSYWFMSADGTVKIFDINTFTVGGAKLDSYKADVNSDDAYTPDTEVIVDGAFAESTFRSAPYFDVQIDGVELLNKMY